MKHFEIHITIANSEGEQQRLIDFCNGRDNIKPVLIDLDGVGHDLMTSSRYRIEDGNYIPSAQTLIRLLTFNNFKILRVKVESDLEGTPLNADFYYESHIRIKGVRSNDAALRTLARAHGAHMSSNLFKDGETLSQMLTIREKNKQLFLDRVDAVLAALEKSYFNVGEKVEREYCVYDSNLNHDKDWIKNEC